MFVYVLHPQSTLTPSLRTSCRLPVVIRASNWLRKLASRADHAREGATRHFPSAPPALSTVDHPVDAAELTLNVATDEAGHVNTGGQKLAGTQLPHQTRRGDGTPLRWTRTSHRTAAP